MAKGCLYCGLQLPDTAEFCPQCGRPIERGLEIRPIQESAKYARERLDRKPGQYSCGSMRGAAGGAKPMWAGAQPPESAIEPAQHPPGH